MNTIFHVCRKRRRMFVLMFNVRLGILVCYILGENSRDLLYEILIALVLRCLIWRSLLLLFGRSPQGELSRPPTGVIYQNFRNDFGVVEGKTWLKVIYKKCVNDHRAPLYEIWNKLIEHFLRCNEIPWFYGDFSLFLARYALLPVRLI